MGVVYTIINHQNKTCYELGTGSWYALFNANRKGSEDLLYKESIQATIISEIWDDNIATDTNPQFWLDYAAKIASELFNFINDVDPSNIELIHDCDDSTFEIRRKQYRWKGSRYQEYDLNELNEHLNQEWVKMYGVP